jgi:hypothetical protein
MFQALFDRLKFRSLLYGLCLLIRYTGWRSEGFRAKLDEKDIAVVLRSQDGTIARTIRCHQGRVRSQKGHAEDVISSITWASPAAGARVILKVVKGDPKALFNAVMAKDLIPEGEASGIRWFLDVVGLLGRIYHKKKSPAPRPA